eukprot:m.217434 g.217434  ORF g.217434 m.217434 type:complete len:1579 (-) comp15601_c0_seq5:1804-6540(-)
MSSKKSKRVEGVFAKDMPDTTGDDGFQVVTHHRTRSSTKKPPTRRMATPKAEGRKRRSSEPRRTPASLARAKRPAPSSPTTPVSPPSEKEQERAPSSPSSPPRKEARYSPERSYAQSLSPHVPTENGPAQAPAHGAYPLNQSTFPAMGERPGTSPRSFNQSLSRSEVVGPKVAHSPARPASVVEVPPRRTEPIVRASPSPSPAPPPRAAALRDGAQASADDARTTREISSLARTLTSLDPEKARTSVGALALFFDKFERFAKLHDDTLTHRALIPTALSLLAIAFPDAEVILKKAEERGPVTYAEMRSTWMQSLGPAAGSTHEHMDALVALRLGQPQYPSWHTFTAEFEARQDVAETRAGGKLPSEMAAYFLFNTIPDEIRHAILADQTTADLNSVDVVKRAVETQLDRKIPSHIHLSGSQFLKKLNEVAPSTIELSGHQHLPDAGNTYRANQSRRGKRMCYHCGSPDHMANTCPSKRHFEDRYPRTGPTTSGPPPYYGEARDRGHMEYRGRGNERRPERRERDFGQPARPITSHEGRSYPPRPLPPVYRQEAHLACNVGATFNTCLLSSSASTPHQGVHPTKQDDSRFVQSSTPALRLTATLGASGKTVNVQGIVDSGASAICVSPRVAADLGLVPTGETIHIQTAGTGPASQATGTFMVPPDDSRIVICTLGYQYQTASVLVMPLSDEYTILLGMPFAEVNLINFNTRTVTRPDKQEVPVDACFHYHTIPPLTDQDGNILTSHGASLSQQASAQQAYKALIESWPELNAPLATAEPITAESTRHQEPAALQFDLSGVPSPVAETPDATLEHDSSLLDPAEAPRFTPPGTPRDYFPDDEFATKVKKATDGAGGSAERESQAAALLLRPEFKDVLRLHKLPADLTLSGGPVRIMTTQDHPKIPPRRQRSPPSHLIEPYTENLNNLRAANIIVSVPPGLTASFDSPSVPIVKVKADGTKEIRFANNFRALNEVTIDRHTIIPDLQELLSFAASKGVYLSRFDLFKAFHQLEIDQRDWIKLAFATPMGSFMYCRAPLGPKTIPAEFNARMAEIFAGLTATTRHYFDDVIIATDGTFDEHLTAVEHFLRVCASNGVVLSIDKSLVAQEVINILGHKVSYQSVQLSDKSRRAIELLREPSSHADLLKINGSLGWIRRFIWGFAELAEPLTSLARRGPAGFHWGDEHRRAFLILKERVANTIGLGVPIAQGDNGFGSFFLYTDASSTTIAGVLVQCGPVELPAASGTVRGRPILFLSRVMLTAEANMSATKRELLAMVWCLRKSGKLILGSELVLVTDHQPLVQVLLGQGSAADALDAVRARWVAEINAFNPRVVYRPGSSIDMCLVDTLTRHTDWHIDLAELRHTASRDMAAQAERDLAAESTPLAVFLAAVKIEALPVEGHLRHERPEQTGQRTGRSVLEPSTLLTSLHSALAVTRSHTVKSTASSGSTLAPAPHLVPTAPPPPLPAGRALPAQPLPAFLPLVWHEEIWLSTATHHLLRTKLPPPDLPAFVLKKIHHVPGHGEVPIRGRFRRGRSYSQHPLSATQRHRRQQALCGPPTISPPGYRRQCPPHGSPWDLQDQD